MKTSKSDLKAAKRLMENGYRRTSRNHCLLSRVDKKDWRKSMALAHSPWNINEGLAWVMALGNDASDHYRRVYSKDNTTVTPEISSLIKTSGNDSIGFVIKK